MTRLILILCLGSAILSCSRVEETTSTPVTIDNSDIITTNEPAQELESATEIKKPAWRKDNAPPKHYSNEWYIDWGWSGEYPNGFSVLQEGVRLKARIAPDLKLEQALNCPVDYLGMYHQWNKNRVDELYFLTASKIYDLEIDNISTTETFQGDIVSVKTFLSGDKITYLTYLSEGWALVKIDGQHIQISIADLSLKNWNYTHENTHQWMGVPCEDKVGWVRYSDVIARPDIAEYRYSLSSWGYTKDITLEQAAKFQTLVLQNKNK